jgi:anti-anti-sigma regulatory factor
MAILYKKNKAIFQDQVSAEEAEALLEWLQKTKHAEVDFTEARHIHTAVIQVLLAGDIRVSAWPKATKLHSWLQHIFEKMQAQ